MQAMMIAGNWKLNKSRAETKDFFKAIGSQISKSLVGKVVATSPTLMETAALAAQGSGIEIYSQNCAWEQNGAWTGEMSPAQILEVGAKGTLIGHSERRQFFGDNDSTCQKRAECALKNGLSIIYCIGESLKERQAGLTQKVITEQLKPVVELKLATNSKFIIAYEPVWAIGTGVVAEIPQVKEAHGWIAEILGRGGLTSLPILYGGSVKPSNFTEIAAVQHVNGGLVGGASLDAKSYLELHACLVL